MTPKEKAFDLSVKFCSRTDVIKPNIASAHQASKCVDEIIKAFDAIKDLNDGDKLPCVKYWEWVKKELENL